MTNVYISHCSNLVYMKFPGWRSDRVVIDFSFIGLDAHTQSLSPTEEVNALDIETFKTGYLSSIHLQCHNKWQIYI